MAKATYYVGIDTYWQDSPDRWFGPYESREAAEQALDKSNAARYDLGHSAQDVRNQTRCFGIFSATESKRNGRKPENTYNAPIPSDVAELKKIEDEEYFPW
jgi:hypothetical protein